MNDMVGYWIAWILVILVGFGVSFLSFGLYRVINYAKYTKKKEEPLTKLEMYRFKVSGPTSLIFGLIFLGIVLFYLKTKNDERYEQRINTLSRENAYLRAQIQSEKGTNSQSFFIDIKEEATSILGGKVLIIFEELFSWGKDRGKLIFKGVVGVSESKSGPFQSNEVEIEKGKQFFVLVDSSLTMGINVIDVHCVGQNLARVQFFLLDL